MKEAYDCGLIIKQLREKANMTQQELGRRINRDKGIISRYENNYQPVPFETMRTFAAIFNVSMDYLAGMEKQKTLSMQGMTEEQMEILFQLAEMFTLKNFRKESAMTLEQYELIKRIMDVFSGA
ncbi:MAG: helix-turn-helix domain-containing protein [Oscillospiraceae bacterium]|nr:helix-turn-helix domain-containing protein [Oscillospiraceae bacterium]